MNHLDPNEREELLRIARSTVREYLASEAIPTHEPRSPRLLEPAGCFVTLKGPGGLLRGCIGTFSEDTPLGRCVQRMAVSAATRDPRFPPVRADELDQLTFEISVLSPREAIEDPALVVVGTHGLCISRGYHHGVLLPQVPVEHQWDRQTYLEHVCLKAGLPPDAWSDPDSRLEVFTAEVFSEQDRDPIDE